MFRKYPELADGEHDKELIATYLELYHNLSIPPEVLRSIPSFETIRRTRQYYSRDTEAAADHEARISFGEGAKRLQELIGERGYELAPASPMIKRAGGLEPTAFGVKDDVSIVGVVESIASLGSNREAVKRLLDLITWVQGAPGMDRNPILVVLGDVTPERRHVVEELRMSGWDVRFT